MALHELCCEAQRISKACSIQYNNMYFLHDTDTFFTQNHSFQYRHHITYESSHNTSTKGGELASCEKNHTFQCHSCKPYILLDSQKCSLHCHLDLQNKNTCTAWCRQNRDTHSKYQTLDHKEQKRKQEGKKYINREAKILFQVSISGVTTEFRPSSLRHINQLFIPSAGFNLIKIKGLGPSPNMISHEMTTHFFRQ